MRLPRYLQREDGVAALEFAIWAAALVPVVASTIDVGIYAWDKVQVANAGQSAVQAAWAYWYKNCSTQTSTSTCDSAKANGFSLAVKNAIPQASSLSITAPTTVAPGTYEGSYCATTSGALATSGCPSGWTNGYYYALTVTYTYHPLFGAASVASLLPTTISQTSWVRLK